MCQETAHIAQLVAKQRSSKKSGCSQVVNCRMRFKPSKPQLLSSKRHRHSFVTCTRPLSPQRPSYSAHNKHLCLYLTSPFHSNLTYYPPFSMLLVRPRSSLRQPSAGSASNWLANRTQSHGGYRGFSASGDYRWPMSASQFSVLVLFFNCCQETQVVFAWCYSCFLSLMRWRI